MQNLNSGFKLSKLAPKLALSISLCISAGSVVAGEMGPVNVELWAGPYFGIYAGSGAGKVRQTYEDHSITILSDLPDEGAIITRTQESFGTAQLNGRVTGSLANLFIGYNFHFPSSRIVFGGQLEAPLFSDVTFSSFGSVDATLTNGLFSGGQVVNLTSTTSNTNLLLADDLRSTFNFIGRSGFLASENALIYALGGATEGHFVNIINADSGVNFRRNLWETGWVAGAGAEYKFDSYVSLLLEYRYMSYNFNRNINESFANSFTTSLVGPGIDAVSGSYRNFSINNRVNYNLGLISIVYRI